MARSMSRSEFMACAPFSFHSTGTWMLCHELQRCRNAETYPLCSNIGQMTILETSVRAATPLRASNLFRNLEPLAITAVLFAKQAIRFVIADHRPYAYENEPRKTEPGRIGGG